MTWLRVPSEPVEPIAAAYVTALSLGVNIDLPSGVIPTQGPSVEIVGLEASIDDQIYRRRGVDLRAGLGQAAQRQVGGIAGTVGNRGAVESDRGCRQCSGVLPGRHRVAEGQHIAGAADITGGAEIVERQRRRAAGGVDGDVLAHGERQRDRTAGADVPA